MEVQQKTLKKQLAALGKLVAGKNTGSLLSNCRLKSEGTAVYLETSDLESSAAWNIGESETKFNHVVSFYDLKEYVGSVEGTLTVSLNENGVQVSSESTQLNLSALSQEDSSHWPDMPTVAPQRDRVLRFDSAVLAEMFTSLRSHVSQNDNRYVYNGVLLSSDMVATDGQRLLAIPTGQTFETEQDVVMHYKAIQVAASCLKMTEGQVSIRNEGRDILLLADRLKVYSRSLAGKFPDWKKVVPENSTTQVTAKTKELLKAAQSAKKLAKKPSFPADVVVTADSLDMQVLGDANQIKSEFSVPAQRTGEELVARFNTAYLVDACKAIQYGTVTLELIGDSTPLTIRDGENVIVIMPIRRS